MTKVTDKFVDLLMKLDYYICCGCYDDDELEDDDSMYVRYGIDKEEDKRNGISSQTRRSMIRYRY